ncbi:hypothetical protein AO071_03155 [Pseudomonas syringae]|nr:hypothetical protein AO071_03155 [Pseudomonas syringae]
MGGPDALDAGRRYTDEFRHASTAPSGVADTWLGDLIKDLFQRLGWQGYLATSSRKIHQAWQTQFSKTLAPACD